MSLPIGGALLGDCNYRRPDRQNGSDRCRGELSPKAPVGALQLHTLTVAELGAGSHELALGRGQWPARIHQLASPVET